MRRSTRFLISGLVFGGLTLFVQESQAQSSPAISAELVQFPELGQALSEDRLDKQDGRQDTQIEQLNMQMANMQSSATFEGNTMSALNSDITTGANLISQGAFQNATGIVTVIQNSGNQVLIQNDMILNLWVK